MVTSFKLDQPITGFFFFEAVFDIIVAGNQTVPPWWEIFNCHFLGLQADATIDPSAVACADWSAGLGAAVVSNMNHDGSIAPADTASHRRYFVLGGVDAVDAVSLAANQEYFLFNVVLDHTTTVDPGSCAGCAVPACIVLNSIRLMDTSFTRFGRTPGAGRQLRDLAGRGRSELRGGPREKDHVGRGEVALSVMESGCGGLASVG